MNFRLTFIQLRALQNALNGGNRHVEAFRLFDNLFQLQIAFRIDRTALLNKKQIKRRASTVAKKKNNRRLPCTATFICRPNRVNKADRWASFSPLTCLMLAHFECPAFLLKKSEHLLLFFSTKIRFLIIFWRFCKFPNKKVRLSRWVLLNLRSANEITREFRFFFFN